VFEKVHLDLAKYMQETGLPMKVSPIFTHLPLVYPTLTRLDFNIFQAFQCYRLSEKCIREI